MPATINGVGTEYYFKSNEESYEGVCEKCGRNVMLQSYETGYWFVILFIPVIPLGKKMIFDYCPSCTNHRMMSLKKWNQVKDDSISKQKKEFDQNPDDPNSAISMHNTLAAFKKRDQAKLFLDDMCKKFPDNFDVQMYAGAFYESDGVNDVSETCFRKAYEIDPENLDAKRAMGVISIENGELDKARQLLSFMEKPGQGQDLHVLYMLANAFYENERYLDAVKTYQIICLDFPDIAKNDKNFRNSVIQAEKMLQGYVSILPPKTIKWGRLIAYPAIVLFIVGSVFIANYLASLSNKLYIVNGFAKTAVVSIAGEEEIVVGSGSRSSVSIAEGSHRVSIKFDDGTDETMTINIKNDFLERFSSNNRFILNVGGGAVLFKQTTLYSGKPVKDHVDKFEYFMNNKFFTAYYVDYAFIKFPDTIDLSGISEYKSMLDVINIPADKMILILQNRGVLHEKLIKYAQIHLKEKNPSQELIGSYYSICGAKGTLDECRSFVAKWVKPAHVD